MSRLIDADKLKAHYAWWAEAGDPDMKDAFDTIIDLQPTVEPTKHGRWEVGYSEYGVVVHRCSLCGHTIATHENSNYCPDCGADMREVEE